MKKMRTINEEKKLLDQEVNKFKQLSIINDQSIDLYKERVAISEKELSYEKTKGSVKGVIGFILGAVVTGAISYGVVRSLGSR